MQWLSQAIPAHGIGVASFVPVSVCVLNLACYAALRACACVLLTSSGHGVVGLEAASQPLRGRQT